MKDVLLSLGFSIEEIETFKEKNDEINELYLVSFVNLLRRYNCKNLFIKEILINKLQKLKLGIDELEYKLEAIVSNGDNIDEVLIDII